MSYMSGLAQLAGAEAGELGLPREVPAIYRDYSKEWFEGYDEFRIVNNNINELSFCTRMFNKIKTFLGIKS